MSAVSPSVGAPSRPQVSLIPPEFAKRRAQAGARALALLIVLIAVGVSIAGWFFATGLRAIAESQLSQEQARRDELNAQAAQFNELLEQQQYYDRAIAAQAWAGSFDIRWDGYLASIGDALPDNTLLAQIEVTQDSPATGRTLTTENRNPANMGQITISGISTEKSGPYDTVQALQEISGFYEVEILSTRFEPSSDLGMPAWLFDIQIGVSESALSGRTVVELKTEEASE